MDPNQLPQPDPKIAAIVKALALTENGGKIPTEAKAGQSGEMKSIFQFTPGTWKMYSKQVLGKEVPLDKGSETLVAYGKVHEWTQQGLNPEEIASMWNSGKPDAYLHGGKGTNKYGVNYDVPGYVEKFKKYLGSAEKSAVEKQPTLAQNSQGLQKKGLPTSALVTTAQPFQTPKGGGLLPTLAMKQIKQVRQI